jgi:Response regulator containing CheY-like receiver domain and AraC-type DNA-binding domain
MYLVVVIDDEIEQLEGLVNLYPWRTKGFEVAASFSTIKKALEYFEKHTPDLVIADLMFPFGNGFDIIEYFEEKPVKPLFCILSAYNRFDYARKAMKYGVQDFLVKPASFEEISTMLDHVFSILQKTKVKKPHDAPSTGNGQIDTAIQIIQKRTSTCTLHSTAEELMLSDAYLSRLFKEKTGENFQSYLLRVKMEQAVKMLANENTCHNKNIALSLGYTDTQNFCRVFKAYYGKSPQEYRKTLE